MTHTIKKRLGLTIAADNGEDGVRRYPVYTPKVRPARPRNYLPNSERSALDAPRPFFGVFRTSYRDLL